MFRNYLTTALRHFWRQKVYSLLNLAGLSIGLASSLLITLWVLDELKFDRFHTLGNRIYFVWHNIHLSNGQIRTVSDSQGPAGPALKAEIPEVEAAVRTSFDLEKLCKVGEQLFKERGRLVDPKTVLTDPTQVVIAESLAQKYFGGNRQAMGKTIRIGDDHFFAVAGVFRDAPEHSSLRISFLLPFELMWKDNEGLQSWGNSSIQTYVLLREGASPEAVNRKIKNFVKQHDKNSISTLMLQPFEQMYLYDRFEDAVQQGGRITYVRLFLVVAAFLLMIACINFTNLATARSATRAREVGVRKVVGANRFALVGQFIGESVLLAFLALILALVLVEMLLPFFNTMTEKHIVLPLSSPLFLSTLIGVALLTGVLAGSYPAFFLSKFLPVETLKGFAGPRAAIRSGRFQSGAFLRQGLVVFQFSLSLVLIVATIVVYRQIEYMKNKDLGLQRENLIKLSGTNGLLQHYAAYRTELLGQPGVAAVGISSQDISGGDNTTTNVEWTGKQPNEMISFQIIKVDHDLVPTLGLRLKEGRSFSREFPSDSVHYLVNEETVRRMGLKNPVGQRIKLWGQEGRIIGLVENFHFNNLHQKIMPVILTLRPGDCNWIYVRSRAGQERQTIASLQKLHRQFAPEYPFEYRFQDEEFDRAYRTDLLVSKLANCFAFIAIFISCLGLFGLAAFTAQKRTKEIGIRKVLGASVGSIVALLSREFLKLVLLANLLAWPLAWYVMNQWLQNFAYQTSIGWWVFGLAGTSTLLIALLTVSYQSVRAARANPVKSLRTE